MMLCGMGKYGRVMTQYIGIVYDVIFLLLVLGAAEAGRRRGFASGLVSLIGSVAGIIGGTYGTRVWAGGIYDKYVASHVTDVVADTLEKTGGDLAQAIHALTFLPQSIQQKLIDTVSAASSNAVPQVVNALEPLFLPVIQAVVFLSVWIVVRVLCRMLGLPARYVVGYAAPQSLFTQQEDGSWHAILQDDNAHAWAEVYISGQGWTPMEMTPGVLVSAQQADLRTDPLPETQGQDTAPAAGESNANEPAATIVPRSRLVLAALLGGCLLAAAVLLVLARRHAMGYGRGSCNARVLAVFGSIYRLLVRRGLPPDTPSDAPEFAAFLQSCVPALEPQDAEALLALAQAAQFGAGTMTEQDTDKMRKLYQVIKYTGKRKQSQKSVEKQSQE